MNENSGHNDNSDELRRALKGLPQVQASADFEARLQRRIREAEQSGTQAGWRRLVRIPAFGYGIVAVMLVGVISFLLLRQQDDIPSQEQTFAPSQESTELASESDSDQSRAEVATPKEDVRPGQINADKSDQSQRTRGTTRGSEEVRGYQRSADAQQASPVERSSKSRYRADEPIATRQASALLPFEMGPPTEAMFNTFQQQVAPTFRSNPAGAARSAVVPAESMNIIDSTTRDTLQDE